MRFLPPWREQSYIVNVKCVLGGHEMRYKNNNTYSTICREVNRNTANGQVYKVVYEKEE